MPAGVEVAVPVPVPEKDRERLNDGIDGSGGITGTSENTAVTLLVAVMRNAHGAVPEQLAAEPVPADQPTNVDVLDAVAESVTDVPLA